MHRFRTLALAVATVALVVSAFGAPATAALGKGSIAVVNGRPGPKLDFCIGNFKIRRNVSYGRAAFRQLNMGDKVLRAYVANGTSRCRGTKVAQYAFTLADGGDLTFVVTRLNPNRVVVYDNTGLGSLQPTGPVWNLFVMVTRTASDLAAVNVYQRYWQPSPDTIITPSLVPVWVKGDSYPLGAPVAGIEWQLRATFPEKTRSIAVAKRQELKIGRRYEWILVGSNGRNAEWVKFSRRVYELGP